MDAGIKSDSYSPSKLGKYPYITSLHYNETVKQDYQDHHEDDHPDYNFWYKFH